MVSRWPVGVSVPRDWTSGFATVETETTAVWQIRRCVLARAGATQMIQGQFFSWDWVLGSFFQITRSYHKKKDKKVCLAKFVHNNAPINLRMIMDYSIISILLISASLELWNFCSHVALGAWSALGASSGIWRMAGI